MYYANFDQHITENWRVVVKDWPLQRFCSPADLNTRNEVEILLRAWQSGVARFEQLTVEDFEAWQAARFEQVLDVALTGGGAEGDTAEGDDVERTGANGAPEFEAPRNNTSIEHPSQTHSLPPPISTDSRRVSAGSKRHAPDEPAGCAAKKSRKSMTSLATTPVSTTPVPHTVTSTQSQSIAVPKPRRKTRRDKGVIRGPMKKRPTNP